MLGAVKTEFGKFGDILARDRRSSGGGNTSRTRGGKTTTIARKLRDVEALPDSEADRLLDRQRNRAVSSTKATRPRVSLP